MQDVHRALTSLLTLQPRISSVIYKGLVNFRITINTICLVVFGSPLSVVV